MTRLAAAFLRHGRYHQPSGVPSAHLPHPLTAEGEAQAHDGAALLLNWARREEFTIHPVIDTSPLLRAWQTARIIAETLPKDAGADFRVESHDALTERCLGSAANLTTTEIEAVVAADPRYQPLPPGWKLNSAFKLPLPGAESMLESGERVAAHVRHQMTAMRPAGRGGTLRIFVGHGGSFRHAAVCLGVMRLEDAPRLSMYHCRPVFLGSTPDGRWEHLGGEWKQRGGPRNHSPARNLQEPTGT